MKRNETDEERYERLSRRVIENVRQATLEKTKRDAKKDGYVWATDDGRYSPQFATRFIVSGGVDFKAVIHAAGNACAVERRYDAAMRLLFDWETFSEIYTTAFFEGVFTAWNRLAMENPDWARGQ